MATIKNIVMGDFLKTSLFESVEKAIQKIKRAPGECLVVFDKDRFLGMITLTELVGQNPNRLIADILIKKVRPLPADSSVTEAFRSFKRADIKRLPVANNEGEIVGVLLKDNLWSALVDNTNISKTKKP